MEEFKLVPDESIFFDLTPEETTLIFYLLGLTFSRSLTIDEINLLANGFFEIAQVMFVIASSRTLINDAIEAQQKKEDAEKEKKKDIEEKIERKSVGNLEAEIKKLQEHIENMQKQIDELKR